MHKRAIAEIPYLQTLEGAGEVLLHENSKGYLEKWAKQCIHLYDLTECCIDLERHKYPVKLSEFDGRKSSWVYSLSGQDGRVVSKVTAVAYPLDQKEHALVYRGTLKRTDIFVKTTIIVETL